MTNFIEESMQKFLLEIENKKKKDLRRIAHSDKIAQDKHLKLIPFRQILKRFLDMGLIVDHTESCLSSVNLGLLEAQRFQVYENESSDIWKPGYSIFFDHPAQVEIAIPNPSPNNEQPAVIIRCTTHHPDSHILNQHFNTIADGCLALSTFLGKNSVEILFPRK